MISTRRGDLDARMTVAFSRMAARWGRRVVDGDGAADMVVVLVVLVDRDGCRGRRGWMEWRKAAAPLPLVCRRRGRREGGVVVVLVLAAAAASRGRRRSKKSRRCSCCFRRCLVVVLLLRMRAFFARLPVGPPVSEPAFDVRRSSLSPLSSNSIQPRAAGCGCCGSSPVPVK
jgi:hypothetical protein